MFDRLKQLPGGFWLLNILQMLEKLAYWSVLIQLPVYIAQKDAPGGLHWEQTTKGIIFFWWALFQNLTPIISGGFADKYGTKKILLLSFIFIISGYIVMGTQTGFFPFLAGAVILGLGSGIFKPALQGAVAGCLNDKTSSLGWGIYFMFLNLGVFFGPPLSKYLKTFSWETVFIGSILVFSLNFIVLIFVGKHETTNFPVSHTNPLKIIRQTFVNLKNPRLLVFIILMAGFAIIYMQFYETLPNFILDWTNTASVARTLHLPGFMLMNTNRGTMISYEWLYNINTLMIIFMVVAVSLLFSKIKIIRAIAIGVLLATVGLALCGVSMNGWLLFTGFVVYTLGEMLTNPKFTEYLAGMAGAGEKSLYVSYLNISFAIGLGGGSLLGGYLYKIFGEKSSIIAKIPGSSESFTQFSATHGLSTDQATVYLWNTFHPWLVWLPFIAIGLISVAGLLFYGKKFGEKGTSGE